MAGTGESEILRETQRTLSKNEVSKPFATACPTHKACTTVNGVTLHRLFYVNPIGYPYEYKKVTSLKSEGLQYAVVVYGIRLIWVLWQDAK